MNFLKHPAITIGFRWLPFSVALAACPRPGVAGESPEHWAFRPVASPPVPAVKNEAWPRSDIDRFVLAALEAKNLAPGPDADRETLARRLSFNLTGLPPSPERLAAAEAGGGIEPMVDAALASERFGEKWARHWLDLARFAETNGKDRNVVFPHAWRYRDWVIGALNRDLPYDRFVREQVAGDLIGGGGESARVATGFLTLGPKAFQETAAEKFAMDLVDEQIDTLSRSVLALTVACARCHDHKFDPIPTADYYALAGIFLSSEALYGAGPMYYQNHAHDRAVAPIGERATALDAGVRRWRGAIYAHNQKAMDLRSAGYRIRRGVTGTLRDRGLKKPSEDPELAALTAKADAMYAEAEEELKKRDALLAEAPPQPAYAMVLREGATPEDCRTCPRGEHNKHGVGAAGRLTILGTLPLAAIAATRWAALAADWLTSLENLLTARVIVNRVWHWLPRLRATVDTRCCLLARR
ncbi:MAG: DUF1549 domain-containing protein [Akkermansiaceae bacterium]|nr:DUF1549 domain-containing protein [Akkermansiaceae bacterium]